MKFCIFYETLQNFEEVKRGMVLAAELVCLAISKHLSQYLSLQFFMANLGLKNVVNLGFIFVLLDYDEEFLIDNCKSIINN